MGETGTKTIIISGCGGGYDIFGALLFYFKFKSENNNNAVKFILVNYSFTKMSLLNEYSQKLTNALYRVTPTISDKHLDENMYFPELRLANQLNETFYAIVCNYEYTKLKFIHEVYEYIMNNESESVVDKLYLVGCGSDILLTGN
ncbi:unnamed protein product, partial [Didymodactylos carnosus]